MDLWIIQEGNDSLCIGETRWGEDDILVRCWESKIRLFGDWIDLEDIGGEGIMVTG